MGAEAAGIVAFLCALGFGIWRMARRTSASGGDGGSFGGSDPDPGSGDGDGGGGGD